jgi:hypothetical protein
MIELSQIIWLNKISEHSFLSLILEYYPLSYESKHCIIIASFQGKLFILVTKGPNFLNINLLSIQFLHCAAININPIIVAMLTFLCQLQSENSHLVNLFFFFGGTGV